MGMWSMGGTSFRCWRRLDSGGPPQRFQRDFKVIEWREGCRFILGGAACIGVLSFFEFPGFEGLLFWIDDPVEGDLVFFVVAELVDAVVGLARGRKDFDREVGHRGDLSRLGEVDSVF